MATDDGEIDSSPSVRESQFVENQRVGLRPMVSEIPVAKRRADAPFAADVIYAHRDVELRNAELAATTACLLRARKIDRCNAGRATRGQAPVGSVTRKCRLRRVSSGTRTPRVRSWRPYSAVAAGSRQRRLLHHRRTYANMFAATVEDLALRASADRCLMQRWAPNRAKCSLAALGRQVCPLRRGAAVMVPRQSSHGDTAWPLEVVSDRALPYGRLGRSGKEGSGDG